MKQNMLSWILVGVVIFGVGLVMPLQASLAGAAEPLPLLEPSATAPATPIPPEQSASDAPDTALAVPGLIEQARNRGQLDLETANLYLAYALSNDPRLPSEYRSEVPWDGTLPLLRLRQSTTAMRPGLARDQVEAILANTCDDSTTNLPNTTSSTYFYIEYGSIGGGLTIDHYKISLDTAWQQEIQAFGWAAPPVKPSNPPPGNLYHVRIDTLSSGLYGYVSTGGTYAGFVGNNPHTAWNDSTAYATCMVLNRDYSPFPGTSQQALDATTAHEFHHSVQFGYGALTSSRTPDDSFVEGSASWMEDEVFDASNDNYNYLWPSFNICMGQYTPSPYNYWITFRGLTERYGAGSISGAEQVMQDFWELLSKPIASGGSSGQLEAMSTALSLQGTTLADAYHAYAIAVKFNKACTGGYVYPFCLEEGPVYVTYAGATAVQGNINAIGGSYTGSVADNYALNWVRLPTTGGTYRVTLNNTSAGGQLRLSVVCDTGAQLLVNPLPSVVGAGGSATLSYFNPAGCTSVIAVITNQSQTAANPSSCTARAYQLQTVAVPLQTSTSTPTVTPTLTPLPTSTLLSPGQQPFFLPWITRP